MQQEIKTILMLSALAHTLSDATMLQARTVIPANPPSRVAGMNKTNYPRIDGSTSTIPLGQLLAARVLGHDAKLSGVPVRSWSLSNTRPLYFPTATPESQTKAFWEFWKKRANHTGTHEAYEALAAGKTDLILVARLASVDELKAAGKVAFDARPIARDALIYIVNLRNTVPSLTLDQLRGIYGGKHKLWRELGGLDFPVLPLVRNRNSGSQELMETLLMKRPVRAADPIEIKTDWGGKETTTRGPNAMIVTSMGEIIERVAKRPEAIAPSVYYYEKF
ncbi:MAG TPA: substrate-binding domain-containing protein, partial [Abditibacteriaceae bacterium]